jgi:hypothetical protein
MLFFSPHFLLPFSVRAGRGFELFNITINTGDFFPNIRNLKNVFLLRRLFCKVLFFVQLE